MFSPPLLPRHADMVPTISAEMLQMVKDAAQNGDFFLDLDTDDNEAEPPGESQLWLPVAPIRAAAAWGCRQRAFRGSLGGHRTSLILG